MGKNIAYKYLQLAEKLQQMISDGAYSEGNKLPSVRTLHLEHNISISTALQVYAYLEKQGWIEAREKSGYYVRYSHRRNQRALPPISKPILKPAQVQVNEQLARLNHYNVGIKSISLIGAAPNPKILPVARLKKALAATARELTDEYIPYGHIQGYEPLRKQIARLSLNWGRAIAPGDIIITNGMLEAATLCLRAVAKPGDTIAIESPTFFGLLLAIENLGMKALEIPTDPVTGIQLDKLEHAFKQKKVQACLLVPNYGNPLGCCIPDPQKEQLAKLLQQYQVPLIEDDVYGDLHFGIDRPKTVKSYDQEGWVLYCSSFSKSVAAGLRIGWIIGGRYHEKISQLKFMASGGTSTLPQLLLNKYLNQNRFDLHLKALRQALSMQTRQMSKAIQDYFPASTQLTQPQGGLAIWVVLPPKVDTWQLFDAARQEEIIFTPGPLFSSQHVYGNCLRLSNANPWTEEQDYAIKTLGRLIKTQL
ncbi:PLP-dependent aminotransferase family protein [Chitinophaga silvatica]|uniref:HTH-type transcriptional regulator NorG n=1 Tax=Chitinophaga silvatica TaxID=2282649 RepID=A0A3E1Y6S5_9BACT|nr:PLP-dependent aminotransferase family protein [Chitinophaga silvatica]RFS20453.1 PLP-dependent aminotransferase family protein [Chitinophaga silvatica]